MREKLGVHFTSVYRASCGAGAALWLILLGLGCSTDTPSDELGADMAPTMAMAGPSASAAGGSAARPESAAGVAGRPAPGSTVNAARAGSPATAAQSGNGNPANSAAAGSNADPTAAGGSTAAAAAAGSGAHAAGAGHSATTSGAAGSGNTIAGPGDMTSAAGSGGAMPAAGGSSGAAGSGSAPASDTPLRVFIASDSTASNYKDTGSDKDQAGWGQMLPEFVKPFAKVDNRAIGGRTARRFIDEGRLDEIWAAIKPGDYLLVQFGTNDGNKNASYELNGQTIPYYLDPATDFKTYMRRYIAGAKERGAIPILVTPPPRNSAYCTGGNGTGAHAQALRELSDSDQVGVVDLNDKTVTFLKAICPEPSPPDFFLQKADGSVDGTHFQERGARKLASFVAEGLHELTVSWVKD